MKRSSTTPLARFSIRRSAITPFALGIAFFCVPAQAQTSDKPSLPTIELSAEASQVAPNDLGQASAYVELTDANPAELSKRINARINEALVIAKQYPAVKVQSAGTQTFPLYGKTGTRIENWRMRSSLSLESKDLPALSELVGKLQAIAAIEQLTVIPSEETRKRATDQAMIDALKAFQARADLAAKTVGKRYRIKHLHVGTAGGQPPMPYMRKQSVMMEAAAAPAPIQAGESDIVVSVNGAVELVD